MALDGIFLSKIKDELLAHAVGLRVDRVNQPTRDEIILNLRSKGGNYKLLICVSADSPRIHFTSHSIDNPAVPPMFCMFLRKHLTGALITDIRQSGLDRVLFIDFLAVNEIGDKVTLTMCIEIMGKCSNLILIDSSGKILDCAKRVDLTTSSVRQVLPGLFYELPPAQNKLNIEKNSTEQIINKILSTENKLLSGALLSTLEGISPVIAREIAFRCTGDDLQVGLLDALQKEKLCEVLEEIKAKMHTEKSVYMLTQPDGRPKDIAFMPIAQYGLQLILKKYDSCSELLDDFYFERDRINRINHRGHELIRMLTTLIERTSRKINLQRQELKKCEDKETLRLYGELITANLHLLKKGSAFYEVPNYYDNMNTVRIPCNSALTPTENSNKYYKDYRKAKTAEVMLAKLITEGENEIAYLESVLDEISRADTDAELSAIRQELCQGGYVKNKGGKKQKPPKELPPIEFLTDDGYQVLVGRNNVQNDRLSMKSAGKNDMWLHTQGFPGSHVIIVSQNGEVSDDAIELAASIAAYFSKARESSLVAVDYTPVRKLKKPVGAKPGKVIYHEYFTIIAKPDKTLVERLAVK
ncbi:MAG: NFACT family protein [Acutalibacteraceae bacterium]